MTEWYRQGLITMDYWERLQNVPSSALKKIKKCHPTPEVRMLAYGILVNRRNNHTQ